MRRRNSDTERLRRPKIHEELEAFWLPDWQIARSGPRRDARNGLGARQCIRSITSKKATASALALLKFLDTDDARAFRVGSARTFTVFGEGTRR
jgi:hypothetical protein